MSGHLLPFQEESQMKQCTKCGAIKPLTDFHKRPETKDGRRTDCKECSSKRRAEQWAALPEEVRKQRNAKIRLKYNYGITPSEYQTKVLEQGNKCFICEKEAEHNKNPCMSIIVTLREM